MKTGLENDIFWSEIKSGFGEPGGTSPPRIPRSTSREFYQGVDWNFSTAFPGRIQSYLSRIILYLR